MSVTARVHATPKKPIPSEYSFYYCISHRLAIGEAAIASVRKLARRVEEIAAHQAAPHKACVVSAAAPHKDLGIGKPPFNVLTLFFGVRRIQGFKISGQQGEDLTQPMGIGEGERATHIVTIVATHAQTHTTSRGADLRGKGRQSSSSDHLLDQRA
eukprot:1195151-Prorocentrum_minimum.AAC.2